MTNEEITNVATIAKESNLSLVSAMLFFRIIESTDFDFGEEWGDEGYMYEKELRLTSELRGNLSDLKRKGLLQLNLMEDAQRKSQGIQLYFVSLTAKGKELAKRMGAY